MRKKEEQLIVTFHTTSDAMGVERLCKEHGVAGRMIPVPRELSAGCGLAWCAGTDTKETLERLMRENGLEYEQMAVMMY